MPMFLYFFIGANLTANLYVIFFSLGLGYNALLVSGHGMLAGALLPLGTSVIEIGAVRAVQWTFVKFITKANAKKPGSVIAGDPYFLMKSSMCFAHSWAEVTRMVALTSGTVKAPGEFGWLLSVVCSMLSNVLVRTGQYTRLSQAMRKGALTRPLSAGGLYFKELKFSMGWPRFAAMFALAIVRLAVHREVSPDKPKFFLFTSTTALCIFVLPLADIIEDCIVRSGLIPDFDESFSEQQLQSTLGLPSEHMYQSFALTKVGTDGSAAAAYKSGAAGGKPCSPLKLHGARPVPFEVTLFLIVAASNLTVAMFELLLGSGFTFGLCDSPVSSGAAIGQAFYSSVPYKCV
jgi:hypothetical protein